MEFVCVRVSLSELDCLEDFLTPFQDLSQCRGSFGAHGFWFGKACVQRGAQSCGGPCHLYCPVEEGTCGKWRDRFL